jgi:hypothetical protein
MTNTSGRAPWTNKLLSPLPRTLVETLWEEVSVCAPLSLTLAGTLVTLHLREDAADYLQADSLKQLVQHYNQFLTFPIYIWEGHEETVEAEEPEEPEEPSEPTDELEVEEEEEPAEPSEPEKVTVSTFIAGVSFLSLRR